MNRCENDRICALACHRSGRTSGNLRIYTFTSWKKEYRIGWAHSSARRGQCCPSCHGRSHGMCLTRNLCTKNFSNNLWSILMLTFHSDWNSLKLMPPSLSVSNMAIIMRQVSGLKGRQVPFESARWSSSALIRPERSRSTAYRENAWNAWKMWICSPYLEILQQFWIVRLLWRCVHI